MRKLLVSLFLVFIMVGNVYAETRILSGPDPGEFSGLYFQWPNSGLKINALKDVTLEGFVFNTKDSVKLDTISLYRLNKSNGLWEKEQSTTYGGGYYVEAGWPLQAGETYRLIATNGFGYFAYDFSGSLFPKENDHISVIKDKDQSWQDYWCFFTNLVTSTDTGTANDTDGDGVIDDWDECPDTPAGSYVDNHGCPTDAIYTQDYLDQAVANAVDACKTEKQSLQNEVTSLTAEKATLQDQVASLTAEKTGLQNQVTSLTAANTALQGQVDTLTIANTALHGQVDDLTAANTALTAQLGAANGKIADLEATNTAQAATIAERDQTIAGLNAIIASMFTQAEMDQAIAEACPGYSEGHGKSGNHPGKSDPPGKKK